MILISDQVLIFLLLISAGKSSTSIVDANMGALKKIIEMVRMEERNERWRRVGDSEGWNYQSGYDCKLKRRGSSLLAESLEIAELVAGTVGFTIVSCTLCLCIVSVLANI